MQASPSRIPQDCGELDITWCPLCHLAFGHRARVWDASFTHFTHAPVCMQASQPGARRKRGAWRQRMTTSRRTSQPAQMWQGLPKEASPPVTAMKPARSPRRAASPSCPPIPRRLRPSRCQAQPQGSQQRWRLVMEEAATERRQLLPRQARHLRASCPLPCPLKRYLILIYGRQYLVWQSSLHVLQAVTTSWDSEHALQACLA